MDSRAPPPARIPFKSAQARSQRKIDLTEQPDEGESSTEFVRSLQRDKELLLVELADQREQIRVLQYALAAKDEIITRISSTEVQMQAALRRVSGPKSP